MKIAEGAEEAHAEEIAKCLAGVSPKPIAWIDRSQDGYRLVEADTQVGRFCYGVDLNNQPYYRTPTQEEDVATEEAAKLAAEEGYRTAIFQKIALLLAPAPKPGPAPAVIAELQTLMAKYASDCEEARSWGGPTIYPETPFTEDFARRYARLLAI